MPMSQLQTDIAGWMNRTDLTTQIPGFITLAETRMNLDLRSWQMQMPITLTQNAGQGSMPVPADWLEWSTLQISGVPLDYVKLEVMQEFIRQGRVNGGYYVPIAALPGMMLAKWRGYYSMQGGNLIVAGTIPAGGPAINVDTVYYQRVTPLVVPADHNWILDTYYGLYLYASLASACRYVKDEARAKEYSDLYGALLAEVNGLAIKAPASGSQWRQRAA